MKKNRSHFKIRCISYYKTVNCFVSYCLFTAIIGLSSAIPLPTWAENSCQNFFSNTPSLESSFFNTSLGAIKVLEAPVQLLQLPQQYADNVRYIEFLPNDSSLHQGQYEVVTLMPGGHLKWQGFKLTKNQAKTTKNVEQLIERVKEAAQKGSTHLSLEQKIKQHEPHYKPLINIHNIISEKYNSKLMHRIKDFYSLKYKVFNRAKQQAHENTLAENKDKPLAPYNINKIDDIIALRHIVDVHSPLLNFGGGEKYFSKLLGLNVIEVETKTKRSGYRAIHLTIKDRDVNYEVQIMSPAMSRWHKWEHDRIYKRALYTPEERAYFEHLKEYSRHIVHHISKIEYALLDGQNQAEITSLIRQFYTHILRQENILNIHPEDQIKGLKFYNAVNSKKPSQHPYPFLKRLNSVTAQP